jgi:hypothetical protein
LALLKIGPKFDFIGVKKSPERNSPGSVLSCYCCPLTSAFRSTRNHARERSRTSGLAPWSPLGPMSLMFSKYSRPP